ncbi:MAG: hypothetical protein ACRBDI_05900 [Alphaproteobacteria bacterium]
MPSIKNVFRKDENTEDYKILDIALDLSNSPHERDALDRAMTTKHRQGFIAGVGAMSVLGLLGNALPNIYESDVADAARDTGLVTKKEQRNVAKDAIDGHSAIKLAEHYVACTKDEAVAKLEGCESVYTVDPETNDVTKTDNPLLDASPEI